MTAETIAITELIVFCHQSSKNRSIKNLFLSKAASILMKR